MPSGGSSGGRGRNDLVDRLIKLGAGGVAGAIPDTGTVSTTGSGTQESTGSQQTEGSQFSQGSTVSESSFSNFLNSLLNIASSQTSTPNLSPDIQALINKLTGAYSNLRTPDMGGYQAAGLANINRNADLQSQSVNNIMAARGLSTSPVAATSAANVESQRFGDTTSFMNTIPLLAYQQNLANLGAAGQFASSVPYGTTTTGQSSQTGQQVGGGGQGSSSTNTQGSQFNQGSQNYNKTNTTQDQTQKKSSGGGWAGTLAGLAGVAASLFSDKRLKKEIRPVGSEDSLRIVKALRPVTWKWKGGEVQDDGFLASDIKKLLPELVHGDQSGYDKVNYAGILPILVGAVQELSERFEDEGREPNG